MKKITLLICGILAAGNLSASYLPAAGQRPCEITEQALSYELANMNMGQLQSVNDHVKTARIYSSLSRHGCQNNADMYREYARASLEAARAMVEYSDLSSTQKNQYTGMINKTALTGF